LVIGSSVRKSHLLKNITTDKKNIAFGRYGYIKKIISANSTLPFQGKETVLGCSGRISPPMKSKKFNVKT
jgi:hypothetical protein